MAPAASPPCWAVCLSQGHGRMGGLVHLDEGKESSGAGFSLH